MHTGSAVLIAIAAILAIPARSTVRSHPDVGAAVVAAPVAAALVVAAPAAAAAAATGGAEKWGPAPAVFPAGAEMAVMQGDPGKAELFTVRLRFPNGYKIAPHTHPTDESITVLSGSLLAGMGSQVVEPSMRTLGRDGFIIVPATQPHYVKAVGLTVVQVHAIGPFALTYVNPADVPKSR